MGAPVLPRDRSASNDLPTWLEFQPRDGFATCGCVEVVGTRSYARSACATCRGAGIVRPRPILSAHELGAGDDCARPSAPGDG